jgi:SAM-dependent methyltransferase
MVAEAHEIVWNEEKIASFWDRLGSDADLTDLYFSKQKGASLLAFVARHIPLKGRVVDLGCGPGYLLEHLIRRGVACEGADLSKDSVHALKQRLSGNELFRGAKVCGDVIDVPYLDDTIDLLFFLEAIEHLLPEILSESLLRLSRTLAPGGTVVITTPYAENLESGKIVCPTCGCRFHRVQHLHSFDSLKLAKMMESAGLQTRLCRPVLLLPDWRVYLSGLRAESKIQLHCCPECNNPFALKKGGLARLASNGRLNRLFRLVYIGSKPSR